MVCVGAAGLTTNSLKDRRPRCFHLVGVPNKAVHTVWLRVLIPPGWRAARGCECRVVWGLCAEDAVSDPTVCIQRGPLPARLPSRYTAGLQTAHPCWLRTLFHVEHGSHP